MNAGQIGEEDTDHPLLTGERHPRLVGSPDPFRDHGREVGLERGIEPAQLLGGAREERDFLVRGALAPQLVEHAFDGPPLGLRRRDRRDGTGVPAIDTARVCLQVEPAERPGQRTAAAVFLTRPERDQPERREHQHVPFPPAELPVAAHDDRDHRLGQQDQRDGDGEEDRPAALAIQAVSAPRGEGVQRDRDDTEDRQQARRPPSPEEGRRAEAAEGATGRPTGPSAR